jgi:SAM-dependent methyltransferase
MLALLDNLKQDEQGIYRSEDKIPISYPSDGNQDCFLLEDNSYWFQHRNRCITSTIRNHPPAGPIIDVGGGNGYVTRGLLDAGFDAVLLEPGAEGAKNGKLQRQIPTVICSTFQSIPFEASSLDAIGCFDVIEHIEDDHGLIENFFHALKPGGLLYVTVPAHQWLWSQSDIHAQHYRRYNRAMIDKLLAGRFEVIYFSYFFSILSIPIFIFRALPFRLFTSKGSMLSKKTEHGINKGPGARILKQFLDNENKKIQHGKSIRFGASCLIVARKVS